MLTARRANILRLIVAEHIATGIPVPSEGIVSKYGLKVSPATVRNEMAVLEEEGYAIRPHISAGALPSAKAYRYYVESLMQEWEVPSSQQLLIRHQFHQVQDDLEEWIHLAAAVLSRLLQMASLVSFPKPVACRFKQLNLVSIHDFLALLILILNETKLKQQLIAFEERLGQEELNAISRQINQSYRGLRASEILEKPVPLRRMEEEVVRSVIHIMQAQDQQEFDDLYLEGMGRLLGQPEFHAEEKRRNLIEVWEERSQLRSLFTKVLVGEGVRVVIGVESGRDEMRDLSLVLSRYGIPGKAGGALGILGPTRMPYEQAVGTVSYLSSLMTEFLGEIYGRGKAPAERGKPTYGSN